MLVTTVFGHVKSGSSYVLYSKPSFLLSSFLDSRYHFTYLSRVPISGFGALLPGRPHKQLLVHTTPHDP